MAEIAVPVEIEIWSAGFQGIWTESIWLEQLDCLPLWQQKDILRYRRWQDRQLKVLSRMLLLAGLQKRGFPHDCLKDLKVSQHGRPYLPGAPDFNLSHSGFRAVCAFSNHGRVGIDLEEYRCLDPREFNLAMSPHEITEIMQHCDSSRRLLQLWTAKESAAKAHGIGLGHDFRQMNMNQETLNIESHRYWIREIAIDSNYVCCLAMETEAIEINFVNYAIGPER